MIKTMIKFHNPFATELKSNQWLSNFNLVAKTLAHVIYIFGY